VLRWFGQSLTTGKLRGPLPIYYLNGEKNCTPSAKVFCRGVGKNRAVQYIPPGGEKHEEGGGERLWAAPCAAWCQPAVPLTWGYTGQLTTAFPPGMCGHNIGEYGRVLPHITLKTIVYSTQHSLQDIWNIQYTAVVIDDVCTLGYSDYDVFLETDEGSRVYRYKNLF
jgi:hypothetical protein